MRNLILSFALLFLGCGDSKTESLTPCLKGTFGSNTPLKAYSSEEIKDNQITNLEKRLTFREDGTGFYYVPVIKNQFPEYRVEFTYTNKNDIVELIATKLFINGVESPSDGLNRDEELLEWRLNFYKLFPARIQQVNCTCTGSTLQTNFLGKIDYSSVLDNTGDIIFEHNKITEVSSWIKRN